MEFSNTSAAYNISALYDTMQRLNDTNTTHLSTTLSYDSDIVRDVHGLRIYVKFYALSVLLPFGFFFNTLAFLVFMLSPGIRQTTTGRFLMALSVADNIYLTGKRVSAQVCSVCTGSCSLHVHETIASTKICLYNIS